MFSCTEMFELIEKNNKADQKLMYADEWDYKDTGQLPNKIREALEKVDVATITDPYEKEWYPHILWLWYHHAISCALWKHGNKNDALEYSEKALSIQPKDHPNKITKLLYLLIREDLEEAEKWAKTIETEPEKTTAQHDIDKYKNGNFFQISNA